MPGPEAEPVLTAAQMRAAEQAAIAGGTTADALMERAGAGVAEWVWRIAAGRGATVLCGPGNNGGDGYVIARILRERGLGVTIVATDPPGTDTASRARAGWGDEIETGEGYTGGDVFVDCLFGSGLSRPLCADHVRLLHSLAERHEMAIAVDLPSGVDTDSGRLLGDPVRCDLTLALGAWKPAHFLMPALGVMGERRLVGIGVEPGVRIGEVAPRPRLAAPRRDAHKYSRGLAGVVGGAMPGAALLTAMAAMRGGAGYVKLLSEHAHPAAPAALVVDGAPLAETLRDSRWSALVIGPGLGRDDLARERLVSVLERRLPCVLDADALHLLDDDLLEGADAARILVTPHAGELAKLCDTFGLVAEGKVEMATRLAEATGVTVLAKGPDTVLAAPGARVTFFPPAPAWLATAGTGDVLAGLAASRLAAGSTPDEAACEAVWLHAEAARIAGPMLIADDLVAALPAAYQRFL